MGRDFCKTRHKLLMGRNYAESNLFYIDTSKTLSSWKESKEDIPIIFVIGCESHHHLHVY